MSKHTPGPWYVGSSIPSRIHCVDAVDPKDGQTFEVCQVFGIEIDTVESEESHANCRLLAAAPELLEALDLLVQLIIADCDLDTATQKAEAVLAKAKGEER